MSTLEIIQYLKVTCFYYQDDDIISLQEWDCQPK